LGEGMVSPTFFSWLKKSSYRGPICQHHEYKLGEGQQMLTQLQRDREVLQKWLRDQHA
jgi:hypothetical protein